MTTSLNIARPVANCLPPRNSRATIRQRFAARARAAALALGASVVLVGTPAWADTYSYTGPTGTTTTPVTGNFTNDFTDTTTATPLTTPAGNAADVLSFGGTASYTATDDIAGTLTIGGLTFANSAGTATLATGTNNSLLAGQNLAVTLNNAGPVTISGAVNLNGFGATFTGSSVGAVTLSGAITGSGGLADNATSLLTITGAANTFTGGLAIGSGADVLLSNGAGETIAANAVAVQSGGEFQFNTGTHSFANAISFAGVGIANAATGLPGGVVHQGSSGNTDLRGALTLTGNALIYNTGVGYFTSTTGTIGLSSYTLNISQAASASVAAPISGTGGVSTGYAITSGTSAGSQNLTNTTLTLTGNNSFSGTTTIGTANTGGFAAVTGGTLSAAGTTTNKSLGATTSILVNSGTLRFATANQASTAANITLGQAAATSGTAEPATSGLLTVAASASQGTGARATGGTVTGTTTQGLGALTLNNTATLTFAGTGNGATLVFGSFTPNSNVLSINGYVTTASAGSNTSGGGATTDDRLIFQGDQTANFADFNFNGAGAGVGVGEVALDNGFYEITTGAAVPEPATWAGAAWLCVLVIGRFARRSRLAGGLGSAARA